MAVNNRVSRPPAVTREPFHQLTLRLMTKHADASARTTLRIELGRMTLGSFYREALRARGSHLLEAEKRDRPSYPADTE